MARNEVYGKVQKTGLMVQAHEALKPCAVEASVPVIDPTPPSQVSAPLTDPELPSQTLCLATPNENPNRSSLEDVEDLPEKGQGREPPGLSLHAPTMARLRKDTQSLGETSDSHQSQATEAKHMPKTSQNNARHRQKKITGSLNEDARLRQSLELLFQETEGWKQSMQGPEGQSDKGSRLNSLVETTLKAARLPGLLRLEGPVEAGSWEAEEQRAVDADITQPLP